MTEAAVETYDTTTRGAASMAAYRAVRILQLLIENTGDCLLYTSPSPRDA